MDRHIIADSSALVALMNRKAANHVSAQATLLRLTDTNADILVPQEVFLDTIQMLYNIFDDDTVPLLFKQFMHSPPTKKPLGNTTWRLLTDAINKFGRHPMSSRITPYLVMSWADAYDTKEIFGFHPLFATFGYTYPASH